MTNEIYSKSFWKVCVSHNHRLGIMVAQESKRR